jgi:hypothetical protein
MYSFGLIIAKIKLDFDASQNVVNLVSSFNTGFIFMSGENKIQKLFHVILLLIILYILISF